ncbi:translation initiation factor IF-6 [archaeon]|jgi:translation initiation factor 6|nr:translation initiation factor IF-6 [archaeon]MBT4022513.1 translation initiation factor IF-6 [archaeon]MBT4272352.1 translation initiation factor IF-6 [archaeon]MBT4460461.1 translation initiation factor IF-6 [archaeon]MBT4858480.1 translation initiation factor IF-6 [archaeon]
MHILKTDYNGNPNIGLFCYATDKYCLVPVSMQEKEVEKIKEALDVPAHRIKVAGTDLLGVFFSGNEEILFVPKIMFDKELKVLDELKIKYQVIDSDLTALGNNMVVANDSCILNPDFEDNVIKKISKIFKTKKGQISGLNIVGSLAKGNKTHMVVSSEIEESELKFLKDNLKLEITKATVNFGSPYVSSGIVCNSNGFLVGDLSGGPEIHNVDIGLGFLEE